MKTFESIAIGIPEILLPKPDIDLSKWAVIACDQFTSEPEYWQKVRDIVGASPSALNLIYPEVYLGEKDPEARITSIREHMRRYLENGLFEEKQGFIYVERQTGPKIRKGVMVCIDLEQYDFHKGSSSLVRATEGTILERIPPRVKIREGAPLEVPHIMVLIDDPENTVIGPLTQNRDRLEKIYDFNLMLDSGHLAGFRVNDPALENGVIQNIEGLASPETFEKKYGLSPRTPVLLFAMGDGNHSLATAKTIWEKTKEKAQDKTAILSSPLRYAMVELVNLHDEALSFEPIHRVLFELAEGRDVLEEMKTFYPERGRLIGVAGADEMTTAVDNQHGNPHKIGVVSPSGVGVMEVTDPDSNLPVGTLQNFLDVFLKEGGAKEVDYIHGTDTVLQLGKKRGNMGFYLPAMNKNELFKTVILDGATPRKTFSMGEAWEKRFYMEARRLT
jgi:uncharacterized protein (DUF1015 family)